jgi:hypothetical protein
VHTALVVEAKLTGKPELAVALTEKGAVPDTTLFKAPNEIVWTNNGGKICSAAFPVKL